MPIPATLNTNEVKDRAGAEVEFREFSKEGRTHVWSKSGATDPSALPFLKISHQETGAGLSRVRRSMSRVDIPVTGKSGKTVFCSAYKVVVVPEGELTSYDTVKDASAMLDSFNCTTGAATAVLFDGTGYGDSALINGTID